MDIHVRVLQTFWPATVSRNLSTNFKSGWGNLAKQNTPETDQCGCNHCLSNIEHYINNADRQDELGTVEFFTIRMYIDLSFCN